MSAPELNWKRRELPTVREPQADDWVAECGVCEGQFAIRAADSPENPAPTGSFCPDCKQSRLIAPGVLHWRRRLDLLAEPFLGAQ